MSDRKNNQQPKNGIIAKTLEWAYNKAVVGFSGVDSAIDLGDSYLSQKGNLEQQVNSLIRWQVAKSATSGFVTGLGGIMVMPLSIPANIASVLYVQIRMIAAIAYMNGHNLNDDKVKALIYISMAGNGAKELIKDFGIKTGERLITHAIQKSSVAIASKSGGAALSSAGKAIPLLGGVIGGSIDAASTKLVGVAAKRIFLENQDK